MLVTFDGFLDLVQDVVAFLQAEEPLFVVLLVHVPACETISHTKKWGSPNKRATNVTCISLHGRVVGERGLSYRSQDSEVDAAPRPT